jgi:CYTH domain-containing protein
MPNSEIERKFLVDTQDFEVLIAENPFLTRLLIVQYYLGEASEHCSRLRYSKRIEKGKEMSETGYLTIKSQNAGMSRSEYETPIDPQFVLTSKNVYGDKIEKTRFLIMVEGLLWEVDVFHGKHQGLIIAEVELVNESQAVIKPWWAKKELTDDSRAYNHYLASHDTPIF